MRRGYLVRTRADADTVEARTGDTTRRDAALASGAQWVSTDYPAPGTADRFGTDYVVSLPGDAIVRCNPVSAPGGTVTLIFTRRLTRPRPSQSTHGDSIRVPSPPQASQTELTWKNPWR